MTQAYGAQATPHVFIFDKERKLQYEGRIDNAQRESLVKIQDARLALDAMLAGKPVATPHTAGVRLLHQVEIENRQPAGRN